MTLNKELEFMDLLSIASFCITLKNLDENLSQNDKQDLLKELTDDVNLLLEEIHKHLEKQDEKLDYIIKELESNDS